jgi:hypothetical protein
MPHTAPDLRNGDDAWLDRLLGDDAAAMQQSYIDDDGFTASVMSALPAPAALPQWRRPAIVGMWAGAGLFGAMALPDAVLGAAREALRLLGSQPVSLSGMAAALAAMAIVTWGATAFALKRD